MSSGYVTVCVCVCVMRSVCASEKNIRDKKYQNCNFVLSSTPTVECVSSIKKPQYGTDSIKDFKDAFLLVSYNAYQGFDAALLE